MLAASQEPRYPLPGFDAVETANQCEIGEHGALCHYLASTDQDGYTRRYRTLCYPLQQIWGRILMVEDHQQFSDV